MNKGVVLPACTNLQRTENKNQEPDESSIYRRLIYFIYLFVYYAVIIIISVIFRRQFTYSLFLGKQTSTRLENASCPRALQHDFGLNYLSKHIYLLFIFSLIGLKAMLQMGKLSDEQTLFLL